LNKTHTCKNCGNEFIPKNNNQKYCSKECSKQVRKIWYNKYNKQYREEHREDIRIQKKKTYNKNKKEIIKKSKIYMKKYLKNPIKRLIANYRARIWNILKHNYKNFHTKELIGCSIENLKSYLELQFTEGMSWQNYGKWHVDHIRQCCTFDLTKPEQQKLCFNYINLRPLWAVDNLERPKK